MQFFIKLFLLYMTSTVYLVAQKKSNHQTNTQKNNSHFQHPLKKKEETPEKFSIIHHAPIILKAQKDLKEAQYFPVKMYRLFKTARDGKTPIPIRFQIDEKDEDDDFILSEGQEPNTKKSNYIFEGYDELVFMGEDVGPKVKPTNWKHIKRPTYLYEIAFQNKQHLGAVYLGVYSTYTKPTNPPPKNSISSEKNYVAFNLAQSEVLTSKYRYNFDKKNYLVVQDIFLRGQKERKVIDASSFYLKLNFKYFITLYLNHSRIDSTLEAFKSGPIRTIARVDFDLKLLTINLNLGMYTEVSFFSNAIILPAEIEIPFDGQKRLHKNSLFYYGYASVDNPSTLEIESNMPAYKKKNPGLFNLKALTQTSFESNYWLTSTTKDYLLLFEFIPSKAMQKSQTIPYYYIENVSGNTAMKRSQQKHTLGKNAVNLALLFDMSTLSQGIHNINFRIFLDTSPDLNKLNQYKTLHQWQTAVSKIK